MPAQDQPVAKRLATDLSERGFVVWLDTWELLPGHNIFDEMYKGITNCSICCRVAEPGILRVCNGSRRNS